MSKKVLEKSSRGITDALFEELEKLRSGESTPQKSRAVSSLCNAMCSVARLEMDYSRFVSAERAEKINHISAIPLSK